MDELTKSIDTLVEELFGDETVEKSSENFEVANASKTTADAAIASAPGMEKDESRGAGRPSQVSDVPQSDEDGSRDKGYEAVQKEQSEEEPEEAKKQAKAVTQISAEGHGSKEPKASHDPRGPMFKSEEYEEYQALKKAKTEADAKAKQEELKKSEDLKKVEQENLIKAEIEKAVSGVRRENEELKKSLSEQGALLKAMAARPVQSKSVTSIEALEKSMQDAPKEASEFTKSDKLDAAEALYKSGAIPMDAVIELENTGTILNRQHRDAVEKKLLS